MILSFTALVSCGLRKITMKGLKVKSRDPMLRGSSLSR